MEPLQIEICLFQAMDYYGYPKERNRQSKLGQSVRVDYVKDGEKYVLNPIDT